MNAIEERARELLVRRRVKLQRLFQTNDQEEQRVHREVETDWPDRAVSREHMTVLEHLTDAERHEALEIDAALQRIERGTYGRCERCQGPIGRQRLHAVPEARLCIACADTPPLGDGRP